MKKIIGARLQIKPDQLDAFIAAAQALIDASRAEAGCISYTMYQNPTDRTSFFFFEEWKDQAAVDFHFATPHFTTSESQASSGRRTLVFVVFFRPGAIVTSSSNVSPDFAA